MIRAIEECPYPDLSLEVRTDSQYTIGCITLWLPKWIEKSFHGVKNDDLIKHLWVLLRRRGNKRDVKFRYVAGHSGERGNEAADVCPFPFSLFPSNCLASLIFGGPELIGTGPG